MDDAATIDYGVFPSPFGPCLLAITGDGAVCGLSFVDDDAALAQDLSRLQAAWPDAACRRDDARIGALGPRLFVPAGTMPVGTAPAWPLALRGTPFQLQVWAALQAIPPGERRSYRDIAAAIGRPRAVRAVGTAIGRNPVGYLVPCHRVVRADGDPGGYRWGTARKRALLAREAGGPDVALDGQEA